MRCFRSSTLHCRGGLAVAVFVALMTFGFPASAAASVGPAVFSAQAPSAGTTVSVSRPTIEFSATDPAGIVSATLTVDGRAQGLITLDYPIGHWEDDGCDMWWVADSYAVVDVARQLALGGSNLSQGTHTVVATVTNSLGIVSTDTWSFGVDAPPAIVSVQPADGANVANALPEIVVVCSDDGAAVTATMAVDGVPVTPSYTPATKTFRYQTLTPQADGSQHSVACTITDVAGQVATSTWVYTTILTTTPKFEAQTPAPGATVTSTPVAVGVRAKDPSVAIDAWDTATVLRVDGLPREIERWYPIGHWEDDGCDMVWVPDDLTVVQVATEPLALGDGVHTVSVATRNIAGVPGVAFWDFTVAAPPVISSRSPASSVTTTTPSITAQITDNDPGSIVATMSVNGVEVPSVFDNSTGQIRYTPSVPLSDGATTTVTVRATDSNGHASQSTWAFAIDTASAATFSVFSPANGSILPGSPFTLGVEARSPVGLVRASTRVWIDGNPIPASLYTITPGAGVRVFASSGVLNDGFHVASVEVLDSLGRTTRTAWGFTLRQPALGTALLPSSGSDVHVPRPTIGLTVSDNSPAPVSVRLVVDGQTVINEPRSQGVVTWAPSADYADGSTHNVSATLTDGTGLVSSYLWNFRVVALPAMSTGADCRGCHDANAHPFGNCGGCHADDPLYDPHGANRFAPYGDCVPCHSQGQHNAYYVPNCAGCHSPAWPSIPRHASEASVTASHQSPASDCSDCHGSALIDVHGAYPTETPFKYQCTVCHASTAPGVIAAISTGDTSCIACHPGTIHTARHVSTTAAGCFGAGCHDASMNLIAVHQRYAGPGSPNSGYATACDLCHANPAVNTDTAGLGCTGSCHVAPTHAGYAASHTPTAESAACTECHSAELAQLHGAVDDPARCGVCHDSLSNWSKSAECSSCHGAIDHIPLHTYGLSEECAECHAPNLSDEHSGSCSTCHDSRDPGVISAITDADLACDRCHGVVDHVTVHVSPLATGCVECHAEDLLTEHVTNLDFTCDRCHADGASMSTSSASRETGIKIGKTGDAQNEKRDGIKSGAPERTATFTAMDIHDALDNSNTSCPTCHSSIHGSLDSGVFNPSVPGYLAWSWVTSSTAAAGSPHGGYTANTNKCAVCHSVHRAVPGGSVLTAGGPYATYAQGCVFCHGIGAVFTDVIIGADVDGYISPHGTCSRCHALNPHGLGTSQYAVLSAKLINTNPDAWIGADLASAVNSLTAGMFDGLGTPAEKSAGITLGTGYLCGNCHAQSFAVNVAGVDPAGGGVFAGHRVTAMAESDFAMPGTVFGPTPGGPAAYADADGCSRCHSATRSDGGTAFPHGYVDASGAVAPKTIAGSSYIWLATGSYLGAADTTILATTAASLTDGSARADLLTQDGLCLRCHRAAMGVSGVGIDF